MLGLVSFPLGSGRGSDATVAFAERRRDCRGPWTTVGTAGPRIGSSLLCPSRSDRAHVHVARISSFSIESSPGVFFAHIPASPSPGCPCPSDGSVQPTISDTRLLRSMWRFTPCHGGDRSPEDPGKRNE